MVRTNVFDMMHIKIHAMKFNYLTLGKMAIVTLSTIDAYGTAFATVDESQFSSSDTTTQNQPDNTASNTVGNQLLCYGTRSILLLNGVPFQTVNAAGLAAHAIGLCP